MSDSNTQTSEGVSFFTLLGLLFIGLKLGKVITWTWPWVLAPFWIPAALAIVIIVLVVIFANH